MDINECFRILEVDAGATPEMVERAFRDLSDIWNPGRYADNPRLKAKADVRYRRIQAAYQALQRHFEATRNTSRGGATSGPTGASDPTVEKWNTYWNVKAGTLDMQTALSDKRRGRRSGLWKLMIGISLAVSIFSAYSFLPHLGSVRGKLRELGAVKDAISFLAGTRPSQPTAGTSGQAPSSTQPPAAALPGIKGIQDLQKTLDKPADKPERKPGVKNRFELHLDNGTVIYTSAYRIDGNLIRYQTAGGTVGIEKDKVTDIRMH